jgi:hypothetical protein
MGWMVSVVMAAGIVVFTTGVVAAQQTLTAPLVAVDNSGVSGTVTLTEEAGKLRVDVRATGTGTTPRPAHIHPSSCSATMDEVDESTAPPEYALTTLTNGSSTTLLDVPLSEILKTPHSVEVHVSETEENVDIACADLRLPGALPNTGEVGTDYVPYAGYLMGLALIGLGWGLSRARKGR